MAVKAVRYMEENNKKSRPKRQQQRGPKPPKRLSERYLDNSSLGYLQRFPSSINHFRDVMHQKIKRSCRHHTDQDPAPFMAYVEKLVERYTTLGLLDDTLYAKALVNSLRRRGASKRQIEQKTGQKGLDDDTLKHAIEQADEEFETETDAEIHAALRLAKRKRLGPFARPGTRPADDDGTHADHNRALAAMGRAGFSYNISKKVLEMTSDDVMALGFTVL